DLERPERVELVDDVGVLVERRAVTNLNEVVNILWTGGKRGKPRPMFSGQRLERPESGVPRPCLEAVSLFAPPPELIVIAADQRQRLDGLDAVDDGVWIRAVADQVAEHEGAVIATSGSVCDADVKRFEIGVDVGQNKIAHAGGLYASSQSTSCSTSAS